MKLYKVIFDSQPDFVEAETFGAAIQIWRKQLQTDNPDAFWDDVEPEAVELVHDASVLRTG